MDTRSFIHLESFASERRGFGRYRFDPEAPAWFRTPCADATEAAAGTSGYADEPEVGLFARRRVFVTLHVVHGHVVSFVDGRTFVWPGPLVATRTSPAPFVKRFEIRERGARLVRYDYWHDDAPGFPGPLASDLFRLIAEVTRSEFSMRRFLERRRTVIERP